MIPTIPTRPGTIAPAIVLSRADLRAHDPTARENTTGETRYLCPLAGCAQHHTQPSRHRSLSLNEHSGQWHCHRCGVGGVLRDYWRSSDADGSPSGRWESRAGAVSRRRATARAFWTPAGAGAEPARENVGRPTLPTPTPTPTPEPTLRLLADDTPSARYLRDARALSPALCRWSGNVHDAPRFFGRPAVVFDYVDIESATEGGIGTVVVARVGRYTDGRDDPKTRAWGAKGDGLFVVPGALSSGNGDTGARIVVCEAAIDALSLAACGVWAVATGGATMARNGRALAALRRRAALGRARIVCAFDNDSAGDAGAQALSDAVAPVGGVVTRLRPPSGGLDWNDALATHGADALAAWLRGRVSPGG